MKCGCQTESEVVLFRKESMEISTILNYLNLVLNLNEVFNVEYEFGVKKPKYNFYVDSYRIDRTAGTLKVRWTNPNQEEHFVYFKRPPFKNQVLNSLYFKIFKQVETTDRTRLYPVLCQVIFPDFCEETGLVDCDFSKDASYKASADHVMCSIYQNFFTAVPVEKFIKMFNLEGRLSNGSVEFIRSCCKC